MATTVLYDFSMMSALLFVSKVIRAKVRFIQKLYIPSALIAVLFGSLFLGGKTKAPFKQMFNRVDETFLVNCVAEVFQFGFFSLIGVVVLPKIFAGINKGFALMLPAGFVGGHGTAAAIGGGFADNGWADATSIGQTFATIGLLAGILGGDHQHRSAQGLDKSNQECE